MKRTRGPDLSNWRSVRRWEADTRERLQRHHWLWLHGWGIGLVVIAFMWVAAHLQMVLGSESLALRYLVTLGAGYLGFLLVLRCWAGSLVAPHRSSYDGVDGLGDIPGSFPGGSPSADATIPFRTGGGGDFGGGGATGDFGGACADAAGDSGSVVGEVASGALEVAAGADEGAVVVVPVVAVFLIGCLVLFGAGSLLLVFFGWEVLLTVAVEIAFGYVSARTAVRVAREGWLTAAVRLTWKPLLGALACAVLLGAALDAFVPDARSLPHAVRLIRGQH